MKNLAAIFILLLYTQNVLCRVREGERCVDKITRALGQCVQPEYCQSANEAFFNSGTRPTFCEYSNRRILICCVQVNVGRKPDQQSVWSNNNDSNNNNNDDGADYSNNNKFRALPRVSERKCKEYSKDVLGTFVKYIYGGTNAAPQDYPHMGAVGWLDFHGEYTFGCGGSLISPRFVLTAGHCTSKARATNPVPVIVRLGNVNLNPESGNGYPIIDAKIKQIHKHPDYHSPLRYNDIALLELAENLEISKDVRPACLWTMPDFGEHTKVVATGWGVTENTTVPTNVLQMVTLSLFSNEQCNGIVPRTRYWDGFASSQMCAGDLAGGKDTCQGDSGAPLQVTPRPTLKIYYIMGVTSFGGRCAKKGQAAIYSRVSSYLDWIESVVWPDE